MTTPEEFIEKTSQYFTLEDGETKEATYNGFSIGPNPMSPEKEAIFYKFITASGYEKPFKSSSIPLFKTLKDLKPGTKISITRTGVGFQTKYAVKVL